LLHVAVVVVVVVSVVVAILHAGCRVEAIGKVDFSCK